MTSQLVELDGHQKVMGNLVTLVQVLRINPGSSYFTISFTFIRSYIGPHKSQYILVGLGCNGYLSVFNKETFEREFSFSLRSTG